MAKFKTPVEGFTGVVAGVTFKDGVGETDDAAAIAYFDRHGYKAGEKAAAKPAADEKAAPAKKAAAKPAADEK